LAYTNGEVIVTKKPLKGANAFFVKVKALGKTFEIFGNYIDPSELHTENYYKKEFLSWGLNKTLDDLFNYNTGGYAPPRPKHINRDVCKSIEAKLKLWA
jgi:hypothetical protein